MNEATRQARTTTQAADGIPRMSWTLAEFERLAEIGILTEQDHVELVGGELIPTSPKGRRHEAVRGAILNWLRRELPPEFDLHVEPGWRPHETDYVEPDFLICRAGCDPASVAPADVILVIEVAYSSLKLDTTVKASTYARHGVRDYWVVDAKSLATRIYSAPSPSGYGTESEIEATAQLALPGMPAVHRRLAELPLA